RAVVDLFLQQCRGALRVGGIVDQLNVEPVLLACDIQSTIHLVDVFRDRHVAGIHTLTDFRPASAERNGPAERYDRLRLRSRKGRAPGSRPSDTGQESQGTTPGNTAGHLGYPSSPC